MIKDIDISEQQAFLNQEIAKVAKKYVGNTEISGNKGFENKEFEELMTAVGWRKDQAWCAYFTELVWKEAYNNIFNDPNINKSLDILFSAGAVATFNNFRRSEFFTSDTPCIGSLVIWQTFRRNVPHWTGHAGIVVDHTDKTIVTVEGNTNQKGSREGDGVYEKLRIIKLKPNNVAREKAIKGFVHPKVFWGIQV